MKCKACGENIEIRTRTAKPYIYDDNMLITSNDRCKFCHSKFFYIEKSSDIKDIIFPRVDYGFHYDEKINNIYSSYVPVISLMEENKEIILRKKEKFDIVVGFDGWEDIVLDKSLAGLWFMTQNSPPMLDMAILNLSTYCFGKPNIIMSYFPTPYLKDKVSILEDRTPEFFEEKRAVMLDEFRKLYIGIRS